MSVCSISAADMATAADVTSTLLAGVDVPSVILSRICSWLAPGADTGLSTRLDVLEMSFHPRTPTDARVMAARLGLGEPQVGDGGDCGVHLVWRGWVQAAVDGGERVCVRIATFAPTVPGDVTVAGVA